MDVMIKMITYDVDDIDDGGDGDGGINNDDYNE